MKITIIAPGSLGDVQPYVALGKGLRKAGHAVGVLASLDFQELVTQHDLDFYDLGGSMQTVAQNMQSLLEQGNFLKILSSMGITAQRLASQASRSGLAVCQGSDLIVAGIGGLFVGLALSEKLGIPLISGILFSIHSHAGIPKCPGAIAAHAPACMGQSPVASSGATDALAELPGC